MSHLFDINLQTFQNETDLERDLRIEIIKFQGKALLKLLNEKGNPKSELEEEELWEAIEEKESNNKKLREKVNALLLEGNF